jgi:hypothetical protein
MTYKLFTPISDVAAYTIVTCDSNNAVTTATGGGSSLLGIADSAGALAGQSLQVAVEGIKEVIFGGTVGAGKPITANASGQAVAASEGDYVLGTTLNPAVSGDIDFIIIDRCKL